MSSEITKKVSSYDFASEVQDDVLKLMVKDMSFSMASSTWVKPEYFREPERRWFAKFVLGFFTEYSMPPTAAQVSTEAIRALREGKINEQFARSLAVIIKSSYYSPLSGSREYTIDVVRRFSRHRSWENAIIEGTPHLNAGNYEKLEEIMERAQRSVVDFDAGAYWYFESRHERISRRTTEDDKLVLSTGIVELDIHLRWEGVREGEVALVMAPKGGGKSIMLSHVARRGVIEGLNVAYYSFEMSDEQNADRLDAGFTDVSMWELKERGEEILDGLRANALRFPRSLMIKQYPTKSCGIGEIKRHLETLRQLEGWSPHVLIVDYLGIVKPPRMMDKKHTEMQETLEEFRALCGELRCIGWSAAQVNRQGAQRRTADGTYAAGSWDQLATADYVFIINQEEREKRDNELRIFIDKCRDGRSGITVGPLYTDWERMCFARNPNNGIHQIRQEWEDKKDDEIIGE